MTALSAFAAIYAATGGGPGTATEILNLYAYRISFTQLDFGYGSALAVALLVLTLAVSGLLFRIRTAGRARMTRRDAPGAAPPDRPHRSSRRRSSSSGPSRCSGRSSSR